MLRKMSMTMLASPRGTAAVRGPHLRTVRDAQRRYAGFVAVGSAENTVVSLVSRFAEVKW
ncbi:hypothetical protein GCM10009779_38070 [Polymorphospora rubra]|uniref:Uncharacterized protein n=2 Tax=Polymorphospora rubra TaxID=338584 RepID=A0A810NCC4_9ACTN|nr:hypothetical protein Prubr_65290 [Polymorphospora rubra]